MSDPSDEIGNLLNKLGSILDSRAGNFSTTAKEVNYVNSGRSVKAVADGIKEAAVRAGISNVIGGRDPYLSALQNVVPKLTETILPETKLLSMNPRSLQLGLESKTPTSKVSADLIKILDDITLPEEITKSIAGSSLTKLLKAINPILNAAQLATYSSDLNKDEDEELTKRRLQGASK
jgi:hypothetical protein